MDGIMNSIVRQIILIASAGAGRSLRPGRVRVAKISGESVVGELEDIDLVDFVRQYGGHSPELLKALGGPPRCWAGIIDIDQPGSAALFAVEQLTLNAQRN